jgi:hypothetical protein
VGCRSWLCKGTPKMMKIFTKNVDFQYWFLSPKTYEKILILETPKINIKYWFPLKINIGFQILIVINIGCSGRLKSAMISCHIYGFCVTITGQIREQASIWWVKASFFPIITLW